MKRKQFLALLLALVFCLGLAPLSAFAAEGDQLAAPTVTVGSKTANSAVLSWGAVANAVGYEVYYQAAGDARVFDAYVTGTTCTVENLTDGTEYTFSVRAVDTTGTYAASPMGTATDTTATNNNQMAAPTGLMRGTGTNTGRLYLRWNAVTGAQEYYVRYRKIGTQEWKDVAPINKDVTDYTAISGGLIPGTPYEVQVRVKAADTANNSAWSAPATVYASGELAADQTHGISSVDPAKYLDPTTVLSVLLHKKDTATTNRLILAYTTDPTDEFSWTEVSVDADSQLNFQDNILLTGLAPNTAYTVKLRGAVVTGGTVTAYAPWTTNVPATTLSSAGMTKLATPTNVAAEATDAYTLKVTWQSGGNAPDTGYNILYREKNATYWESSAVPDYAKNAFEVKLSVLQPDKTYEVCMMAAGQYGMNGGIAVDDPKYKTANSEYSAIVEVTTPALVKLSTPQNVKAEAVSDDSIRVSWDAVEHASGYVVLQGNNLVSGPNPLTDTECVVGGLVADTNYSFVVVAIGDGDSYTDSEESAQASAKTFAKAAPDITVNYKHANLSILGEWTTPLDTLEWQRRVSGTDADAWAPWTPGTGVAEGEFDERYDFRARVIDAATGDPLSNWCEPVSLYVPPQEIAAGNNFIGIYISDGTNTYDAGSGLDSAAELFTYDPSADPNNPTLTLLRDGLIVSGGIEGQTIINTDAVKAVTLRHFTGFGLGKEPGEALTVTLHGFNTLVGGIDSESSVTLTGDGTLTTGYIGTIGELSISGSPTIETPFLTSRGDFTMTGGKLIVQSDDPTKFTGIIVGNADPASTDPSAHASFSGNAQLTVKAQGGAAIEATGDISFSGNVRAALGGMVYAPTGVVTFSDGVQVDVIPYVYVYVSQTSVSFGRIFAKELHFDLSRSGAYVDVQFAPEQQGSDIGGDGFPPAAIAVLDMEAGQAGVLDFNSTSTIRRPNGGVVIEDTYADKPYTTVLDIERGYVSPSVRVEYQGSGSGGTGYTITATADKGGNISPSGKVYVASGADQKFIFTPDTGYRVYKVLVDGKEVKPASAYTFNEVRADHTIHVSFVKIANLNTVDHFAYVEGYPEGDFRPEGYITRAEVAAIFARLITDKMETGRSYPSKFTDVEAGAWYADYVGFLEQYGLFSGYSDGTFRPNNPITRAELTAIAVRFFEWEGLPDVADFSDLSKDHWAYGFINAACQMKFIEGYSDGTFRPNNPITRAETVTFINRVLNRAADGAYISAHLNYPDFIDFPDIQNHWARLAILEAANGHDYTRESADAEETWTNLK